MPGSQLHGLLRLSVGPHHCHLEWKLGRCLPVAGPGGPLLWAFGGEPEHMPRRLPHQATAEHLGRGGVGGSRVVSLQDVVALECHVSASTQATTFLEAAMPEVERLVER